MIADGLGFTVNTNAEKHDPRVYVTDTLPDVRPVTAPEEVIVAVPVVLDKLHVPLGVALPRVTVAPRQTPVAFVIPPGVVFTVIDLVTKQLFVPV